MRNLLILCCVALLLPGCGSKKEFTRTNVNENLKSNERLFAELYRDARLLELLDIKYKQVETRDSAGNVRIETGVDFSQKKEEHQQDSAKITGNRQEDIEKVVDHDEGKERDGVMSSWVWIVGFIAVIVIALAVIVYLVKSKR